MVGYYEFLLTADDVFYSSMEIAANPLLNNDISGKQYIFSDPNYKDFIEANTSMTEAFEEIAYDGYVFK